MQQLNKLDKQLVQHQQARAVLLYEKADFESDLLLAAAFQRALVKGGVNTATARKRGGLGRRAGGRPPCGSLKQDDFQDHLLEKMRKGASSFEVSKQLQYLKKRIRDIYGLQRMIHDGLPIVMSEHDRYILRRLDEKFKLGDLDGSKAMNEELYKMIEGGPKGFVPLKSKGCVFENWNPYAEIPSGE